MAIQKPILSVIAPTTVPIIIPMIKPMPINSFRLLCFSDKSLSYDAAQYLNHGINRL